MRYRGIRWSGVLAVVAIIVALIAITTPKLGSRGDAKMAQCAADLAQIGKGLAIYATANNDKLPQGAGVSGASWLCDQSIGTFGLMREALRSSVAPSGVRDPEKFFFCPKNGDQDRTAMLTGGGDYVVTGYAWFTDRGANSGGMAAGRREMIMDWIVSDTSAAGAKKWTGMTFAGRPGVYSTSHTPQKPQGANVLSFDGHVEWRAFDERKATALPQGAGAAVFWVPAP